MEAGLAVVLSHFGWKLSHFGWKALTFWVESGKVMCWAGTQRCCGHLSKAALEQKGWPVLWKPLLPTGKPRGSLLLSWELPLQQSELITAQSQGEEQRGGQLEAVPSPLAPRAKLHFP